MTTQSVKSCCLNSYIFLIVRYRTLTLVRLCTIVDNNLGKNKIRTYVLSRRSSIGSAWSTDGLGTFPATLDAETQLMTIPRKDRWGDALGRLQLALLGDWDATDMLDQSRLRIRNARDALERTGFQPRRRPVNHIVFSQNTGADERAYLVLIDDRHNGIIWQKLVARDDIEAMDRAGVQAGNRAFDLWDGWRFIDRVESPVP